MKRRILIAWTLLMTLVNTVNVVAQTPTAVISLWPDGAPTSNGLTGPERDMGDHVSNVTQPTLTVWAAAEPNGLAVLACPGGGYVDVCNGTEGNNMAEWYKVEKGCDNVLLNHVKQYENKWEKLT